MIDRHSLDSLLFFSKGDKSHKRLCLDTNILFSYYARLRSIAHLLAHLKYDEHPKSIFLSKERRTYGIYRSI